MIAKTNDVMIVWCVPKTSLVERHYLPWCRSLAVEGCIDKPIGRHPKDRKEWRCCLQVGRPNQHHVEEFLPHSLVGVVLTDYFIKSVFILLRIHGLGGRYGLRL